MLKRKNKLTLSMIVKNESERYLERALLAHREWIDAAVIIDDGSTDDTPNLCKRLLDGIPLKLITNPLSQFSNEVVLRKQQWQETIQTDPDWVLNLDADEVMGKEFGQQVNDLLDSCKQDAIYFRLYDMWDDTHYREDMYWRAHLFYRPFLIHYRKGFPYTWKNTPQHCGRFPDSIHHFSFFCHAARVQHFGWARHEDRIAKYSRYQQLDPEARYGWKEQYESILDATPIVRPWA